MFYDFLEYTFDLIPDVIPPDLPPEGPIDIPDIETGNNGGSVIGFPGSFSNPISIPIGIDILTPERIIDLLFPIDQNYINLFLDPRYHEFYAYPYELDWNPENFNGIGTPLEDAECWNIQTRPTSCAVMAQISIYESVANHELPEDLVCEFAEENGWYDDETGTTMADTGKILEELGIPVERSYGCSLGDIARAIANGDEVIVGLDASEIWDPYRDVDTGLPLEQNDAGHAVWVTGLDIDPNGQVKVILNDSGTPDGRMMAVDAVDFMNAWEDYDCFMAVAETSSIAVT